MRFYGVLDHQIDEVIELYVDPQQARLDLADILWDEPSWWDRMEVVAVDLGADVPRVVPIVVAG